MSPLTMSHRVTGWKAEESLCVFRLSFLDGELQRPSLHRHKALTGTYDLHSGVPDLVHRFF